jgi:hypothetical protein
MLGRATCASCNTAAVPYVSWTIARMVAGAVVVLFMGFS